MKRDLNWQQVIPNSPILNTATLILNYAKTEKIFELEMFANWFLLEQTTENSFSGFQVAFCGLHTSHN